MTNCYATHFGQYFKQIPKDDKEVWKFIYFTYWMFKTVLDNAQWNLSSHINEQGKLWNITN